MINIKPPKATTLKLSVETKKEAGKKFYFLMDEEGKEIFKIADYPLFNHDTKIKNTGLSLGKGQNGEDFERKNPFATLASKKMFKNDIELDRYRELSRLFIDADFQKKYASHINIPFVFKSEKGTEKLLMKKVHGHSLLNLTSIKDTKIILTKRQIMSLYKAMLEMAKKFNIVHLDIHSGNIMLEEETGHLVLIDFDECLICEKEPAYIPNPDYDTDPYGYEEEFIPDEKNMQSNLNSECYVSQNEFEHKTEEMKKNYQSLFLWDNSSIFLNKEFLDAKDDDETPWSLNIPPREAMSCRAWANSEIDDCPR